METQVSELMTAAMEKAKILLRTDSAWSKSFPATSFENGIPTLEPGRYRAPSPQLQERFEKFGRWEFSTNAHWLSVQDMQGLWNKEPDEDEFLNRIRVESLGLVEGGWMNSAPVLFRPERLTLFAASDLDYESVFLLWLDCEAEPEIWVYDSGGEARFKDLARYLQAYMDDDVTAPQRHWKLAEIERFGS